MNLRESGFGKNSSCSASRTRAQKGGRQFHGLIAIHSDVYYYLSALRNVEQNGLGGLNYTHCSRAAAPSSSFNAIVIENASFKSNRLLLSRNRLTNYAILASAAASITSIVFMQ